MNRSVIRHLPIDGWLLIGFVVACFLLGGSYRGETSSMLFLRPLAAAALTIAIIRGRPWPPGYRVPIGFAMAAGALVALQLVPLPPAIWTALPGREPLLEVAKATDVPLGWRPLSMQPVRTWNSLFALLVPTAVLLLGIAAGNRATRRLLPVLIILGGVSALLGLLQVISSNTSPLYLYSGTGDGYANGLFANRNHHAAVIACLFPMMAVMARMPQLNPGRLAAIRWILAAMALFLMPLMLLTGSRAGLLLAGIGMASGAWLYMGHSELMRPSNRKQKWVRLLPLLIGGGALVLVVALSILMSRAASIDRLFGTGMDGGRRLVVYPTVWKMVQTYSPLGAGFGTFAEIFQINEPDSILGPTYLNQAHNDWLQILIEGGIPAALLALGALFALFRLSRQVLARPVQDGVPALLGRAGLVILVILGLASIVDYPVRVPSVAALAVVALLWMLGAKDTSASKSFEGWRSVRNSPRRTSRI